jgi:hypothetical protein
MREWTPSNWSYGMTMRRGKRVSLDGEQVVVGWLPFEGEGRCVCVFPASSYDWVTVSA